MKSKQIISLAVIAVLVAGVAIFLTTNPGRPPTPAISSDTTGTSTTADSGQAGTAQVIAITVKGGYTPPTTRAKAGVPLALKLKTDGTYDCSAEVRIASIGWSQDLKPTGEVAVQIPAQKAGSTLVGVCSMGMYNFKITFE